jgi:hypothetical protein
VNRGSAEKDRSRFLIGYEWFRDLVPRVPPTERTRIACARSGGVVSLGGPVSTLVIHDGVNVTFSLDVEIGGHLTLSALFFDGDEPGVSASVSW